VVVLVVMVMVLAVTMGTVGTMGTVAMPEVLMVTMQNAVLRCLAIALPTKAVGLLSVWGLGQREVQKVRDGLLDKGD
jgi:hypothetical protein